MSTRKIVPRANGEGAIGDNTSGIEKYWGAGYFNIINSADAIEMAAISDDMQWKANTIYTKGSIVFTSGLKAGMYLEGLVAGISGSTKFSIPATLTPNVTTITDNTVTWILREVANNNIEQSSIRQPNTVYLTGDIRYLYGELPVGWFLECTTAGTTANSDLTINSPSEGDTVTDGTVTWTIKKMGSGNGDGVPLGSVLPLAHNSTIPAGYLLCDGSAVSRTMYPNLFAAIGTTYGAGDGSTTFNLPDYTNRFIEGSNTAGTSIAAGLPNIIGAFRPGGSSTAYGFGDGTTVTNAFTKVSAGSGYIFQNSNSNYNENIIKFDASLYNSIYSDDVTTVQPPALTARYIIKAFDSMTAASALIDITQYANDLANKAYIDGHNVYHHKDVITTSGTYTAPATGLYKITVKGGGGGGAGGSTAGGGVGGGEGGTTIAYEHMTAGDSATVVIGAGGTAGSKSTTALQNKGTDGGDSSVTVNSTTYTAGGGAKTGGGGTGTIVGAPGGAACSVYSNSYSQKGAAGGGNGGGHDSDGVLGGGGAGGIGNTGNNSVITAGYAGGDGYVWFEYTTASAN